MKKSLWEALALLPVVMALGCEDGTTQFTEHRASVRRVTVEVGPDSNEADAVASDAAEERSRADADVVLDDLLTEGDQSQDRSDEWFEDEAPRTIGVEPTEAVGVEGRDGDTVPLPTAAPEPADGEVEVTSGFAGESRADDHIDGFSSVELPASSPEAPRLGEALVAPSVTDSLSAAEPREVDDSTASVPTISGAEASRDVDDRTDHPQLAPSSLDADPLTATPEAQPLIRPEEFVRDGDQAEEPVDDDLVGGGTDGTSEEAPKSPPGGADKSPNDDGEATEDEHGIDVGDIEDPPTKKELAACRELMNVDFRRIKVLDLRMNSLLEVDDQVVAIRITGKHPPLEVTLTSQSNRRIKGLCLFVAGDQSRLTLEVKAAIGRLVYVGRGNNSQTRMRVDEHVVIEELVGDLAGNQALLAMSGKGRYPCDGVRLRGHDARFVCE